MERPPGVAIAPGVAIVAILTLLSVFALGFLFLTFFVLSVVGMGGGVPFTLENLPFYLPLFFALFAFASSVSIIFGTASKYLWYSLMGYWIVMLIYFVPLVYAWNRGLFSDPYPQLWEYEAFAVTLLPLIYAVGCLSYFLTKAPREYFHVNRTLGRVR